MKKRILAWIICLSLFLTIVPASAINSFAESLSGVKTIDNGYIRVYVSEENGGFSVSLAEGDRLKKSDNNKKLLYHDGEYDTSFISLKIGEGSEAKEYLFGGKCDTSEPLKVTQAKENGEIKAEWAVNNIRFTQVISLAADASNEHGMVSLSLFAENNGEEKKILGQSAFRHVSRKQRLWLLHAFGRKLKCYGRKLRARGGVIWRPFAPELLCVGLSYRPVGRGIFGERDDTL